MRLSSKAPQPRDSRSPKSTAPLAVLLGWFGLIVTSASLGLAQEKAVDANAKPAAAESVPALSLESLYHPQQKFDFDGELPATHWIGDSDSQLLIQRDEGWNQVDLETHAESPWPTAERLREQLAALDGIDQEQAKSAANRAVQQLESTEDQVLVRVDKSLAIVSANSPARWLTRDATAWQDATLDPTDRFVAYTRDGNLFVLDARRGKQWQFSNDGSDTLLNGRLDWTYQEEIYGRGNYRGFWFSPDGNWLAMLRIDIAGIEPYLLASSTSDRGRGAVSRYPKAGDPIPHASLIVWDLRRLDSGSVPPPRLIAQSNPSQERIITGVWWHAHRGDLWYCVTDRLQTWRELRVLETEAMLGGNWESRLVLREESPAWVEPAPQPGWLPDGGLIWRSELPTGRTRLYRLASQGQMVTPLTPDHFDVREFFVSPQADFVLVTGDLERRTVEQHVYRVAIQGESADVSLTRLTHQPGWHSVSLSPDGRWLLDQSSSATSPTALAILASDGSRNWELASSPLRLSKPLRDPRFFAVDVGDGISVPAMLVRPSATNQQKVPVLIEVYGGPQAPMVVDRWSGTRSLYRELLAREGIATLIVDNRSSAGRGLADTWTIRGRVGEVECEDLKRAVQWLKSQPWVASDRLAIRGWSFGGFLTLYAMTHSDAFAAGIAGGSVTDWREYDAFYTERYMGLPQENAEGYRVTAPVGFANQLHGSVLLIHGEADDNVHPSGTLRMARALQQAGKDFQLMIYPEEAHAIRETKNLWHLSQMTHQFLKGHLLSK